MKSSVPTPAAHLATAMAHTAAACYWIVGLVLTVSFAVHFNSMTAKRWAYSCLSGWLFTWCVLEVVKVMLTTIVELSQLNQRRNLVNEDRLKERIQAKREKKMKQMTTLAQTTGVPVPALNMNSLLPVPPPPPEPPPPMGADASAG